jgi:hypothetical protein
MPSLVHVVDREALRRQPRRHRRDIAVRQTEFRAELLRRQPMLELRGFGIVLAGNQRFHFGLMRHARFQDQLQVIHLRRIGQQRFRWHPGHKGQMAFRDREQLAVVDGLGDPRRVACVDRLGRQRECRAGECGGNRCTEQNMGLLHVAEPLGHGVGMEGASSPTAVGNGVSRTQQVPCALPSRRCSFCVAFFCSRRTTADESRAHATVSPVQAMPQNEMDSLRREHRHRTDESPRCHPMIAPARLLVPVSVEYRLGP